jgi:NADPH-dependent ferric siderophore reductase
MTASPPVNDDGPAADPTVAAALPQPQTMSLEVAEVADLGPSLRQIRLGGESLRGFEFAPGQDLMLRLPLAGGDLVSRRYTIRRADPSAGLVDLNVVMHGDGPAARWANAARPGQLLPEVVGPRGKITLAAGAAWHLFVGDETYLPGTLAMLEALPGETIGRAILAVSGPLDEQPVDSPGLVEVNWLHRGSASPADAERLLEQLRGWQIPAGRGHVYIAAEVSVALTLRDELFAQGLSREQVSAKGYWSRERANASRGEPDVPA